MYAFRQLAAGVLAGVALTGCGGSDGAVPQGRVSHEQINELRSSAAGTVYWLGETFEGLPLTHVEAAGPGRQALVVYGSCKLPPGADGGCAPPLQLQHWTLAGRHPSKFDAVGPGRPVSCTRLTVQRVPAAIFGTSGGAVEVYAGNTVVVVWAEAGLARRAAAALRTIDRDAPTGRLSEPPSHVRKALAKCGFDSTGAKLRELRRTQTAPLFWLGRSFAGHPLVRVEGRGDTARFVCGACARDPSYLAGEGCWAPFELEVTPVARRNPSSYASSIRCRRTTVRGAPVALIPSAHTAQLFTGTTTVTIYAKELTSLVAAARSLRDLRDPDASRPLPPPPRRFSLLLARRCG